MLVGHQPAIQDLALRLAVEGPELEALRGKFPTAALATLTFEGDWSELGQQGSRAGRLREAEAIERLRLTEPQRRSGWASMSSM